MKFVVTLQKKTICVPKDIAVKTIRTETQSVSIFFLHVCKWVHTSFSVLLCECMWKPGGTSGFLHHPLPYSLETVSLTEPKTVSTKLTGPSSQDLPISAPQYLGYRHV